MMDEVFALYLEQDDEQIKAGNPTRLLGVFSSKARAKKARDAVKAASRYESGNFEIVELLLDEDWFNDGFVTEHYFEPYSTNDDSAGDE